MCYGCVTAIQIDTKNTEIKRSQKEARLLLLLSFSSHLKCLANTPHRFHIPKVGSSNLPLTTIFLQTNLFSTKNKSSRDKLKNAPQA